MKCYQLLLETGKINSTYNIYLNEHLKLFLQNIPSDGGWTTTVRWVSSGLSITHEQKANTYVDSGISPSDGGTKSPEI